MNRGISTLGGTYRVTTKPRGTSRWGAASTPPAYAEAKPGFYLDVDGVYIYYVKPGNVIEIVLSPTSASAVRVTDAKAWKAIVRAIAERKATPILPADVKARRSAFKAAATPPARTSAPQEKTPSTKAPPTDEAPMSLTDFFTQHARMITAGALAAAAAIAFWPKRRTS